MSRGRVQAGSHQERGFWPPLLPLRGPMAAVHEWVAQVQMAESAIRRS